MAEPETTAQWRPDFPVAQRRQMGLPDRPPCEDCGQRARGDIFTVCEECWNERSRKETVNENGQ